MMIQRYPLSLMLLLFAAAIGRAQDMRTPVGVDASKYLVGEFPVARVVDGDTIAVEGLESTIRFLCIDTEECEKGPGAEARTQKAAEDYLAYVREQTREDPLARFNTPMGWEAKKFAETWFPIGSKVRIEYDSPSRKTGYYGRVLGYVLVLREGQWVNYNVECVRAGMSPYFDKYGPSLRFEAAFIAAEREARIHGRGIWSPYAKGYPRYDDRLASWWRRSRTLTRFEARYAGRPEGVVVMDEDGWRRLAGLEGSGVVLLGQVRRILERASPPVMELHHKEFLRLAVRIPDPPVFESVKAFVEAHPEDFLCFEGVLEEGLETGGERYAYRLTVSDARQVFFESPEDAEGRRYPGRAARVAGDRIHWRDAAKHVGREVCVAGRIVRTRNIGDLTFLNFDPDFRSTLAVVIKAEHYDRFPEPPEATYLERTVLVRGTITEYRGAPQIEVTGPDQIEILE